jgi:hypothetical protein
MAKIGSENERAKIFTLRADFYDDPEAWSPTRSVIICASNEEEAVERAAAQMGNAARIEFVHATESN